MFVFAELIRAILDGDDTAAGTVNRTLRQIGGNLAYLDNIFDIVSEGSACFDRAKPISELARVGQPVFWSRSRGCYEPCTLSITAQGGVLVPAEQSRVLGVVYHKLNAGLADIVLSGTVSLDLRQAISGTVLQGLYFLSEQRGKLTRTLPPFQIPVLTVLGHAQRDGYYRVLVNPDWLTCSKSHEHEEYELVCLPAGTAELNAGVWVISVADPDVEGWLPANHAVFGGLAPTAAKFGYNLSVAGLRTLWPLLSAGVVWDRGEYVWDLQQSLQASPDGLVNIDENGIWWLSDCEFEVPWTYASSTTTTTTTTTAAP